MGPAISTPSSTLYFGRMQADYCVSFAQAGEESQQAPGGILKIIQWQVDIPLST